MKAITPIPMTDTIFYSSTVAEADAAEFAMNTTYALGALVMDTTGVEILTLNVAPATAWVKNRLLTGQTSTNTCRVVAQLTSLTYQVRERTGAFTLGEVIGVTGTAGELADQGALYPQITAATTKVHKIYESLSAGNQSNYPAHDVLVAVPKWLEVSATNRWKAFDGKLAEKTSNADSITYVLKPPVINSIVFFGLTATEISLVYVDASSVEVYNETIDLTDDGVVIDWYTYFFEPIIMTDTAIKLDLPDAFNGTLTITINNTGGTAEVGEILFGNYVTLGKTSLNATVGIIDYSTKTQDAFGNFIITERAYSKRMNCNIIIGNDDIDTVFDYFVANRTTPIVWVATDLYSSLIVYGFYKSFDIVIPYPPFNEYQLEIEGLV